MKRITRLPIMSQMSEQVGNLMIQDTKKVDGTSKNYTLINNTIKLSVY